MARHCWIRVRKLSWFHQVRDILRAYCDLLCLGKGLDPCLWNQVCTVSVVFEIALMQSGDGLFVIIPICVYS